MHSLPIYPHLSLVFIPLLSFAWLLFHPFDNSSTHRLHSHLEYLANPHFLLIHSQASASHASLLTYPFAKHRPLFVPPRPHSFTSLHSEPAQAVYVNRPCVYLTEGSCQGVPREETDKEWQRGGGDWGQRTRVGGCDEKSKRNILVQNEASRRARRGESEYGN